MAVPATSSDTHFVPDDGDRDSEATHISSQPRFGRFQVSGRLGAGAMGTVYRADDEVLGRAVAIKTLHLQGDLAVRERFLREARAIGALAHPNILAIYDAGTEGHTPYLVMELATGGSLGDRMRAAGPLPAQVVRQVGAQIARALAAAHAAGILHRDVKPANILAGQGETWKLADFGIARVPDSTLTLGGQFLGSPAYAAPESLRAGQFSPASDVYGLGATLYEAATGVPPRGSGDLSSVLRNLEQEPAPLRARGAIPDPLGKTIMAALARDPTQRPSAEQMARSLDSANDSSETATALIAAATWLRTHPRALLIAGGAVLGLIALIAILAGGDPAPPAAAPPSMPAPPAEAAEATDPNAPSEEAEELPMFVDQYGNPVDEATARQILEQMERAARGEYEEGRGRGRGRWKK